jgi:hypothetical protein
MGSQYRGGDLTRARRATLWNLARAAIQRSIQYREDNASLAEDLLRRVQDLGVTTIPRSELIDWAQIEADHRADEA